MRWDVRNVYLYLVAFVTLIMVITGAVTMARAVADLVVPAEPIRPIAEKIGKPGAEPGGTEPATPAIDPALEEAQRRHEEERERASSRRRAAGMVVSGLSTVAVALPIYLAHWRRIRSLEGATAR